MVNSVYAGHVSSYTAREGITLRRYAHTVGVTVATVERWISGDVRRPQPLHLIRLCRIHGIDPDRPEDLGFTPRTGRSSLIAAVPHGTRTEEEHMAALLRRDFLGITAGVIFGATLTGPVSRMLDSVSPVGKYVGASDIAQVAEARERLMLGGELLGGGTFQVEELLAEYRRAVSLLHGSFTTDTSRQQAHVAAATLTAQIGWELYDLGQHDRARHMWLASLAMARQAEPAQAAVIHGDTMVHMAIHAVALGQPEQALQILSMASGRDHLMSPTERSMIASVKAGATASLGDIQQTRRLVVYAEDHHDAPVDERDSIWNVRGWYNKAEMDGNIGHALTALASHHPALADEAMERMNTAVQGFRPEDTRAKARVQTGLAQLHATLGNRDETEISVRAAVDAAQRIRSPRINGELLALRPLLKRWPKDSGFADVDREIIALAKV